MSCKQIHTVIQKTFLLCAVVSTNPEEVVASKCTTCIHYKYMYTQGIKNPMAL